MKRKMLTACAISLFALPVFGISTALADTGYTSSSDTSININESLLSTPTLSTGDTLFTTQESLYQVSGTDVQHDYTLVNLNGSSLLAIDPPKVCF